MEVSFTLPAVHYRRRYHPDRRDQQYRQPKLNYYMD